MSKNLTHKGLALGAVVALGASLFAGTPASAATSITLDTAFGTSGATQSGILGEYFTLAASEIGGTSGDKLKLYVEGAAAANVVATSRAIVDLETAASTTYTATTAGSDALDDTRQRTIAVDNTAKIATVIPDAYVAGKYLQVGIKLGSAITDTTTIKVTPFIDNGIIDNKPSTGELTGTPVSITFVKPGSINATAVLKDVVVGSAVTSLITLDNSINVAQLRAAADGAPVNASIITAKFLDNGAEGNSVAAAYNVTDKVFSAVGSAAVYGHTYGANTYVNSVKSGSATAAAPGTSEIETLGALTFAGTSYRATDSAAPGTTTNVVRAGDGSFNAKTSVASVISGKVKGGQTVSFKISEGGIDKLDASASVTAGGKTLTNSSALTTQSITVTAVSAADGSVTLPISYSGIKNNNEFTVVAFAVAKTLGTTFYQPGTQTTTANDTAAPVTLTGEDSLAATLVNESKSTNSNAAIRVAKGGAISLPFKLVDQFGQVPTGTFRVTASVTAGSSATNNAAITSPAAVANGSVTVSATDSSTADLASGYTITAQAQKLGTDGTTYTNIGSTAAYLVSIGSVSTGAAITLGSLGTTTPARAATSLVAGNTDLEQTTVSHGTLTAGTNGTEWASGSVVTSSTGAAVPGAVVTFTAAGVLFKSGNVYGLGSLSVVAGYDGTLPAVGIFSNNTGKQTITVTSGSATKTVDVTWAAVTSGGTTWTITAPATVVPGQSFKVTAVLKDKYGAVVDLPATETVNSVATAQAKVSYTGPGFVTSTLATETDADGVISFTVLLGANDSGPATIKFTYAGANQTIGETSANDDVVATATVVAGLPTVAARLAASTKKFYVAVDNAKGLKVVVKVAGKTVKSFTASLTNQTVSVASAKGKKAVKVYVDGDLVIAKTLTIK